MKKNYSKFALYPVLFISTLIYTIYYTKIAKSWLKILVYPGHFDWGEAIAYYHFNQLADGVNIFQAMSSDAFIGTLYGPLFYIIYSIGAYLSPDSFMSIRIYSIIGLLLITLASILISWHFTRNLLASYSAAVLSAFPVGSALYGAITKPDSLYLGMTMIGFYLALRNIKSYKLLYSVPFFVFALFIKQSAISAPLTIFLLLLINTDFKKGVGLLASCIAMSTLLLLSLLGVFGAGLIEHLFIFSSSVLDWNESLLKMPLSFFRHWIPFIILFFVFYYHTKNHALFLLFVVSFLVNVPKSGTVGASFVYWNEPTLAMFLMYACGLHNLIQSKERRHILNILSSLLIILCTLFIIAGFKDVYKIKTWAPSEIDYIDEKRTNKHIGLLLNSKSKKKIIYTTVPGLVTRHRKKINLPIDDPFLYTQLILKNKIDGHMLSQLLRTRQLDYVILDCPTTNTKEAWTECLRHERITRSHLDMIFRNYKLTQTLQKTRQTFGNIMIFVPRKQQVTAKAQWNHIRDR